MLTHTPAPSLCFLVLLLHIFQSTYLILGLSDLLYNCTSYFHSPNSFSLPASLLPNHRWCIAPILFCLSQQSLQISPIPLLPFPASFSASWLLSLVWQTTSPSSVVTPPLTSSISHSTRTVDPGQISCITLSRQIPDQSAVIQTMYVVSCRHSLRHNDTRQESFYTGRPMDKKSHIRKTNKNYRKRCT